MVTIPSGLRALMAEIGPRWGAATSANVRRMIDEFTRVHEAVPRTSIRESRDLAYGAHPRQRLDIYAPAEWPIRNIRAGSTEKSRA